MFSAIGLDVPTLFAVIACVFAVTLLYVSISENWHAYQSSKRERAADRMAPKTDKVRPK